MNSRDHRSYDFLWLAIALFVLLTIIILLPLQPHDYWWYLRLGRDVLETGAVPVVDTFSSTRAGEPVVYQSWMSAVLLWLVYKSGGIPITIFMAAVLIGLIYTVLWMLIRQSGLGPRLGTLLVIAAGVSGSNNWGIRPQLFAYPLFIGALWILLKWERREDRRLWMLLPIGFLWVNLHGSFVLLFVFLGLGIFFGKGNKRNLFVATLGVLGVSLLNPRGYVLWQSVIETFTAPGIRDLSPEWLPPRNEGWQMNIFFAWLLALVPLAAFSHRKVSLLEWTLFLVFSWLALGGLRYVVWDLFILAILTACLMPERIVHWFDHVPEIEVPFVNMGLGIVLLVLPFFLLPGGRETWWSDSPPVVDPATPVAAVDWLAKHPELPGEMWNEVVFGSYLIHALPSRPVWIDTRIQVAYTAEEARGYLFVQSAQPGWDEYLQKHGINLLLLSRSQSVLLKAVEGSNLWCEEYRDEYAVIFSRCEAK